MFLENFHTPQKNGTVGSIRPLGPLGEGNVHSCSATLGASRTATAHAEGGLKISAACPEFSALLFDESSHAKTPVGRTGTSLLNHSSTCFISSDLTVILPSLSVICAPWARNTADVVET